MIFKKSLRISSRGPGIARGVNFIKTQRKGMSSVKIKGNDFVYLFYPMKVPKKNIFNENTRQIVFFSKSRGNLRENI